MQPTGKTLDVINRYRYVVPPQEQHRGQTVELPPIVKAVAILDSSYTVPIFALFADGTWACLHDNQARTRRDAVPYLSSTLDTDGRIYGRTQAALHGAEALGIIANADWEPAMEQSRREARLATLRTEAASLGCTVVPFEHFVP